MFSIFSLFWLVVLSPLFLIFLLIWRKTATKNARRIVLYGFAVFFGLLIFGLIIQLLTDKKQLDKDDYYGIYIVNRNFFAGKQADWQYNNFRFEIKENDSIYFYLTDEEKILETFRGSISTVKPFSSEILVTKMNQPTHHIMLSNPTIYRSAWSFYLVFQSEKFSNVYFKKGKWQPIGE